MGNALSYLSLGLSIRTLFYIHFMVSVDTGLAQIKHNPMLVKSPFIFTNTQLIYSYMFYFWYWLWCTYDKLNWCNDYCSNLISKLNLKLNKILVLWSHVMTHLVQLCGSSIMNNKLLVAWLSVSFWPKVPARFIEIVLQNVTCNHLAALQCLLCCSYKSPHGIAQPYRHSLSIRQSPYGKRKLSLLY